MPSTASVFHSFPKPPGQGQVTLCEQFGELSCGHQDQAKLRMAGYPDVRISKDSTRSLTQRESAKSAFLPQDETLSTRVYHAWTDLGLTGALEEVVSSGTEVSRWVIRLSEKLLVLTRWTNALHGSFFPHLALSAEDMVAKFSSVSHWGAGPVKSFAWHPHCMKISYVLEDDTVRVHTQMSDLVPILKHKLQKNVSSLAWQPHSSSVLAVGCQAGVLIWHIEPTSLASRPSSSSVQVLQQSNHCPVTCVEWSPDGRVLMSSSPIDSSLLAWDVSMERCTPIRRFGGGGVAMMSWSPDGSKLFSATPSNLFRVWETRKWSCEKWTASTGRVKAACWSPTGSVVLFATENQPIIYSLTFSDSQDETTSVIGGSQTALACVDLSDIEMETIDGNKKVRVGGLIQNMVWDPTGERLAVMFSGPQEYVALFRTKLQPTLDITACGLVRGVDGEKPECIQFQPHYNNGALLTVVWSSGRVGYVPLQFVPAGSAEYHQFHHQPGHVNHHLMNGLYSQT